MHSTLNRTTIMYLLAATLLTSAVHFLDNAFRLDLYPGPIWLTRNAILFTWIVLPLSAWAAYRVGTRTAFVAYALLGFLCLAHYIMPHHHSIPLRCTVTILGEAVASAALIAYSVRQDPPQRTGAEL